MTLHISPVAWSDEAARVLKSSTKWFPLATVEDYRLLVERDADARLCCVEDEAGVLVGFVILKVERFTQGSEGVIIAAAGRLPGADLIELVLPQLERAFTGVASYRVTTARRGLIRKLQKHGWVGTHAVLRKAAVA